MQYLPNKYHHCFGFKLFCRCESETGYIVNFTISEGKGSHVSEHGISHDICIELLESLYAMGYHLHRDNWYTAVPLAETLLAENTNPTGTMRSNRKFLPPDVKKKLAKGDSVAFRKSKLLYIGWQDKKHVIMLTTEGSSLRLLS